jgi:hypothetical protein
MHHNPKHWNRSHNDVQYGSLESHFNRCIKVCDPQCAKAGDYSYGTTNGACKESKITFCSDGEIDKIITTKKCKSYYKIKDICYESKCDKPITLGKHCTLVINQLNVYTITATVYPDGCPMAQLPIFIDEADIPSDADVEIIRGTNTITISGLLPRGTVLRFQTDPYVLKYFKSLKLVGNIIVSTAACILSETTASDAQTKVEYIVNRPTTLSIIPVIPMPSPGDNPLLPEQYPNGLSQYPWTEALIPWKKNQPFPSGAGVTILPPIPVPNPLQPSPPYINGYNERYDKFKSVPDSILYYLGYDPKEVTPTQNDWTLFLRNFADRGYARRDASQKDWETTNFAKRQYMDAFSVDKLQFYLEKINSFVMTSYTEVVANRLPLVSSFQRNVVLFFLNMHIGTYEYPEFVIKYFSDFIKFIGIGDPNNAERNVILMDGYYQAPKVFEYIKARATEALDDDRSSIVYWWNLAGLSIEALLFEAVHNIVAFSQFTNVLYSIIFTGINPTNPINPALPPYPNFLELYGAAATSEDKLNVVREAFRILMPNSNSFSKVNPEDGINIQSRHIHQQIAISNMPGPDLASKTAAYFTYNPGLYAGFPANFDGLDLLTPNTDFETNLPTSPLDEETVINLPRDFIPIFPRPIYTPFGLGYRRCAGEIFVYLVIEMLMEQFRQAKYEIKPGTYPTIYVAAFKGVADNIFAFQPV